MAEHSVWKDLIKPTIFAFIIACAIPAGIAVHIFYIIIIFRSGAAGSVTTSATMKRIYGFKAGDLPSPG